MGTMVLESIFFRPEGNKNAYQITICSTICLRLFDFASYLL